jgi:sigma-54 specific flagellar transcriptional regulator A
VKLLRVLEERAVTRVGGRAPIAVDVRIISATHRDLHVAIDEARFREDLYYRLAVFPMSLPPLAAHRDDIPLLIEHFLRQFAPGTSGPRFTPAGLMRLAEHRWPGNVRELRNVIERAAILYPLGVIDTEDAMALLGRNSALQPAEREALWAMSAAPVPAIAPPAPVREPVLADGPVDLRALVAELEHRHIEEALRRSRGVVADAARLLSLQRTTLIEKMNKYGIARTAA